MAMSISVVEAPKEKYLFSEEREGSFCYTAENFSVHVIVHPTPKDRWNGESDKRWILRRRWVGGKFQFGDWEYTEVTIIVNDVDTKTRACHQTAFRNFKDADAWIQKKRGISFRLA